MVDLPYASTTGVTHDVATATQKPLVYLRERYIYLHGITCKFFSLREVDSDRNNIYGDISHRLELSYRGHIKVVLDTPSLYRRVHHSQYQSDEFNVDPIKGEVSVDTDIREGDLINLDVDYKDRTSNNLLSAEDKLWQVTKVESFLHSRDISKQIKIAPYRETGLDKDATFTMSDLFVTPTGLQSGVLFDLRSVDALTPSVLSRYEDQSVTPTGSIYLRDISGNKIQISLQGQQASVSKITLNSDLVYIKNSGNPIVSGLQLNPALTKTLVRYYVNSDNDLELRITQILGGIDPVAHEIDVSSFIAFMIIDRSLSTTEIDLLKINMPHKVFKSS